MLFNEVHERNVSLQTYRTRNYVVDETISLYRWINEETSRKTCNATKFSSSAWKPVSLQTYSVDATRADVKECVINETIIFVPVEESHATQRNCKMQNPHGIQLQVKIH